MTVRVAAAMFALLAGSWADCRPTTVLGSAYACTGIAYGFNDSSIKVRIGRDSHGGDRAVWTPMHRTYMPFFIRFTYGVNHGRLGRLKEVRAEVDNLEPFGSSYALLETDITSAPSPSSIWRVPFGASREEPLEPGSQVRIWRASAVVASADSRKSSSISRYRQRFAVLKDISDLNFEYFDGTGVMIGRRGSYSLSNPWEPSVGMRASLYPIAYARALHGLQADCAPADSMCECGDG